MKILSRYINTTVIATILLILLILMGLEVLIAFIGQLSDIGTGNYGILQAARFIMLDMPYELYKFIPMAGLIGSLIGLGVLANQSELIVMQAAGFSKGQITLTVVKAALVMALLALILGEVVAPAAEHMANRDRAIAMNGGHALATQRGVWMRDGDRFVHVGLISSEHQLQNISSYQFNDKHQIKAILFAKAADYHHNYWLMHDVKQTIFAHGKTQSTTMASKKWPITIKPSLLRVSDIEPRNMSLIKLAQYISYLNNNGLRSSVYELNFWDRIMQPIATLVMIFLAIPFVFGTMRTVPMGVRILTGVTLGFSFYILNQFFGPLSLLYQIPPYIGAALPTFIFTLIGFALLWRIR